MKTIDKPNEGDPGPQRQPFVSLEQSGSMAAIHPALHYDVGNPERGMAFISVPLIPAEGGGGPGKAPQPQLYLIAVGASGSIRKIAPLDACGLPLLAEPLILGASRWDEGRLKAFLAGDEEIPTTQRVFEEVKKAVEHFMDMPSSVDTTLVTLWIMAGYLHTLWPATGYLRITGNFSSGKSRLCEVITRLAFSGLCSSSASPSSIFSVVHRNKTVVALDESEKLTEPMRLLLNSGYRDTGCVLRRGRGNKGIETYRTYSPKVIASVAEIEPILASRCIPVRMAATTNREKARLQITDTSWPWPQIRSDLYAWSLCRWRSVLEATLPELPFGNRLAELALPIVTLAQMLETDIPGLTGSLIEHIARLDRPVVAPPPMSDMERLLIAALGRVARNGRPAEMSAADVLREMQTQDANARLPSVNSLGSTLKRWRLFRVRRATVRGRRFIMDWNHILDLAGRLG